METSSQLFFAIDNFVPKGKQLSFGALVNKYSARSSLCSATTGIPNFLWYRDDSLFSKPDGALAAILAISYVRRWSDNFFIEKLVKHLFNQAKNYRFQGKWNRVGEILSQQDFYTLGIHGILRLLIKDMSTEDFYGNLLPNSYRIIEKIFIEKPLYKTLQEEENEKRQRPVKRKIRRRGYNDKGSRRPDHKWLPGYDVWLEEQENQKLAQLPYDSVKDPPARYWFKSLVR